MSLTAPTTPANAATLAHERAGSPMLLLLASRSPRRRELLTGAGIEHIARHPGIDDTMMRPGSASEPSGASPGEAERWAAALAYLKAATALKNRIFTDAERERAAWVLGADTVVVKGSGEAGLIGTPADEKDAARMLRRLSDGTHEVVTGVALLRPVSPDPHITERRLFVDRATVHVGKLTDELLDPYLASGHWQGKAGAYNLAERISAGWPITFTGDPGTVMGLPMIKLLRVLGVTPQSPHAGKV